MLEARVHLEHSDASGNVSKVQKLAKAKINAFDDASIGPILSIQIKVNKDIVLPLQPPITLYGHRVQHGQFGEHTSEEIEEVQKLFVCVSEALQGKRQQATANMAGSRGVRKCIAHPFRSSMALNRKASPVRRTGCIAPDSYHKEQEEIVFFTGSAGTGKSLLLKHVIRALPTASTAVTGTTGLSGSLLEVLQSIAFSGIGRADGGIEAMMRYAMRPDASFRWRNVQTLIIDEISMMHGEFFDALDVIARKLRSSKLPFGGIQLVLSGDFHQLPPVAKSPAARSFCFEARAWNECIQHTIELKTVFRQSDLYFIDVLAEVRSGKLSSQELAEKLESCYQPLNTEDGILPTKLFTHRADVDAINRNELEKLPGECMTYHARDTGDVNLLDASCQAPKTFELKVGSQVMLVKNISSRRGLVNGSRGVVERISSSGLPYVKFISQGNQAAIPIDREKWTIKIGGRVVATRTQLPLTLAWAITVHKSQGMSLDRVEISLQRAFEPGMAYVALSRAKSMQGLRICDSVAPQSLQSDDKSDVPLFPPKSLVKCFPAAIVPNVAFSILSACSVRFK
eukprot:jgi/Picre1/31498/NNA_006850.t1